MDILYEIMDEDIVDRNGERCGRVDDIEVEDGFDRPPRVTALLAGNGAKSRQMRGPAHRISCWLHARLGIPHPGEPTVVPWKDVDRVDDDIVLRVSAPEARLNRLNLEVAERIIGRIPGAGK